MANRTGRRFKWQNTHTDPNVSSNASSSKCATCTQSILWIRTKAGKAMCVNPEPIVFVDDGTGIATLTTTKGSTYAKVRTETSDDDEGTRLVGYVAHKATCPNWRRRSEP